MNHKAYGTVLTLIVCLALSGGIEIEALGRQWTSESEILSTDADSVNCNGISLKLLAAAYEAEVKKEPQPASPQDRGASKNEEPGDAPTKETSEIQKLKEKIIELQNKGKLGFSKVVLCNSIEGFGLYSPFEPGQPLSRILLYFEPSNVSTLVSEGRFIVDLAVDVFLVDTGGKVIGGKQNMLKINKVSRSPILDLFYKLEMNIKKPLKREILMKTVLHDRIKNQSTSMTYKVNMEPTGAKPLSPI
jgi:hypothetical protein